jgi:phenylalanyl-tRNA synthetase alpha subunit
MDPTALCRIFTAGRVWRDDEEDERHLRMFHQLDLLVLGPGVREGGVDGSRFSAVGFGLGLERLAMIRYGIDDIRTMRPKP